MWDELFAILLAVTGAIALWILAARSDRKKLGEQEHELIERLPANEWKLIEGGGRITEQEFAMHSLRDQPSSNLRPLVVGLDGERRYWIFRYNYFGKGHDECSDSAVIVVRDSAWQLPRVKLVARRWRSLASRQPLRDLGVESQELLECWAIDDGVNPSEFESTRRLVHQVLPTMQRSEPLNRAEFNGEFLTCIGMHADSVEPYLQLLHVARRLATKLDHLYAKG